MGSKIGIMVFVVILLALAFFFFFDNFSLNVVRGSSMEPTFGACTLVVSDLRVLPSSVVVGDIVVIDISDRGTGFDEFAHRVVFNDVGEELMSTRQTQNPYQKYQ